MLDEIVEITCKFCGESHGIVATQFEWDMWYSTDRPYVQRCFPTMSAENREMLISGICPTCWDKTFGENS